MKLISVLLVLTVAVMGCATGPRPMLLEPVAQAEEPATDTPPQEGMSTGQIIGTVVLVLVLLPVVVLALAYSSGRGGSRGGYGSRTYTSTVKYDTGKVTTYKTTISGHRSTTTVRSR